MGNKNLYFTDEQEAQVTKLAEVLVAEGIDIHDNRKNISISKLFRYLIEKELDARGLNTHVSESRPPRDLHEL